MKITIYELLGLIKDGKAPEKIKVGKQIYIYDDFEQDYVEDWEREKEILKRNERHTNDILYCYYLFASKTGGGSHVNITKQLNYEVEIIEEEQDIEYLGKQDLYVDDTRGYSVNIEKFGDKINELIKEVNKLKNK